ncbi:MAG: thiamine ABC transporter substrate-binding protein [Candidatus Nanopelagicales bacterium]
MRIPFSHLVAAATVSVALAACSAGAGPTSSDSGGATAAADTSATPVTSVAPTTVTLLTHDSFALSTDLLDELERSTGVTLRIAQAGDAGELVNKAALTAGNPEGDVLFGVDNTLLSRAVDAGVFDAYVSPAAAGVPADLVDSGAGVVTPVDYGDVCVNIDDAWFADADLAPPATLEDLADPRYRDLLVVENPATSSPGLAFLLATVARYGEDGFEDYWARLRDNGVTVANGWTEAYQGEFTAGGGDGTRPLVVSYASSPPAEIVYAADPKPTKPSTSVLTDGCYRQIEYAGVLAGTEQPEAARLVVDWLLSPAVQADVPLSMFVFPAVSGTPLPQVFTDFAAVPADPLTLDPAQVDAGRTAWVDAWTQVVLR